VWNNQFEDDPSLDELRRMLVDKRRKVRQERLERFRKTGRVVRLASDMSTTSLEGLASESIPDSQETNKIKFKKNRRKRFLDTILLIIEVGAVITLLFLMLSGAEMLRNLNLEVAEVLELPTLTPTPMIVAMVLPSGHTSPNSASGAAPNNAEIPEHLRPLVQSLANIPVPTPGPEQANRIQIPAIKVDAPIVQGDGWEQLKKGVGQHIGSANPGEPSNIVLSAHNDVFGEIFRDLDRLKPGDQVIIYTQKRSYTYTISTTEIVEPTRVDLMTATTQPVVTLISCYPYLVDSKRIVVRAHLQSGTK
jgi:sortase A